MKTMWKIFKDNSNMTFEIVGITNDDTMFTKEVADMQSKGLNVSCATAYIDNINKENIIQEYKRMGF